MNPFQKLAALPLGAAGQRGYSTAAEAKAAAVTAGHKSYAVLVAPRGAHLGAFSVRLPGEEFAWVAPASTYACRAAEALAAGIKLVEAVGA